MFAHSFARPQAVYRRRLNEEAKFPSIGFMEFVADTVALEDFSQFFGFHFCV